MGPFYASLRLIGFPYVQCHKSCFRWTSKVGAVRVGMYSQKFRSFCCLLCRQSFKGPQQFMRWVLAPHAILALYVSRCKFKLSYWIYCLNSQKSWHLNAYNCSQIGRVPVTTSKTSVGNVLTAPVIVNKGMRCTLLSFALKYKEGRYGHQAVEA